MSHTRHASLFHYLTPPSEKELEFPVDYRLVAEIEYKADAADKIVLEHVFAITTSGSPMAPGYWGDFVQTNKINVYPNPNNPEGKHRSSSCGDVVFIPDEGDGKYYYCDDEGWIGIDRPFYPVDVETFTFLEEGVGKSIVEHQVNVVQLDEDTFDLFEDGECLNEGNPIYGPRPTRSDAEKHRD